MNGSLDIQVALKRYNRNENIKLPESEIPDLESAWSREADRLEEFASEKLDKTHIARGIGSFSIHGERYIIMPWPPGGTLRQFWDTNPSPKLCGRIIEEFLEQYRNLAISLEALHEHADHKEIAGGVTLSISQGVPQTQENNQVSNEVDNNVHSVGSNWWHGNLKPQNILRQPDQDSLGALVIGGLGLAKKHTNLTGARTDTSTRLGTMFYEPPEASIDTRAQSRPYDI